MKNKVAMINTNEAIAMAQIIEKRLTAAFNPSSIVVHDQSAAHRGHEGAAKGGHFQVVIAADAFINKSRIQVHQLIYQQLTDLMNNGIHALSIKILPSG